MSDIPPVDRSKQMLTDGSPVPEDRSHIRNRGDGQQAGYIVLTPEERAKGFVKPVRRSYTHKKCGVLTTMGLSLAETYARDPYFYSGTFCCGCGAHFDLEQFNWSPDGEPMDPLLQEDWLKQKTWSDAQARERRARERVARAVDELDAANKEFEQAQMAVAYIESPVGKPGE